MTKNRARRTSLIGGRLLHAFHHGGPGPSGAGHIGAGWSSPVARQAHNLKVVGSNPTPATKIKARNVKALAGFFTSKFRPFAPRQRVPPNAIEIKAFALR